MNRDTRMVADVGGTNTRIALFDPAAGNCGADGIQKPRVSQLRRRDLRLAGKPGEPAPRQCCIAVAAPPARDLVKMSNMDWSFSCSELARRHGFRRLVRINDFESNAYALPTWTASN